MSSQTERVEATPAQQESAKLAYDLFKHLTTLSTGSLLVIVAFIEKVYSSPKAMYLVSGSLVFFILTIILAVWNLIGIICIAVFAFKNFYV
ncbi:hypothetical protein BBM13_10810 [Vibrio parahaemolyticus]|uniref:hypothetical protein n=1 Tax=Vibrio parahaemolyticus TaxID=670 RepID=UPI0004A4647C|nr:hypothetical protein [Vibrio parahaemolyticus]MBE3977032.1 hypothetical protein [Vibrio parahaemolyticus]ODX73445.1 hypothetical protein BBM12_20040 [Vibrio parahaemolyticus]ODX82137.1 hypothetical protein BBM93_18375 [Vibrio parahaemolyticus]ODX89627.1 hypothetical protein BBM13_10810 [Vibrio parahaemolyticus]ODX97503.1 hypothetical protein BBM14_15455 [Vibrio parahaemolyticus]